MTWMEMALKRQEWEELEHWKEHGSDLPKKVLDTIRVADYGELKGVRVYGVDGKFLRNHVDIDFTTGANPGRYVFCPDGEVWVEQIMTPSDFMPCIVHEFIEYMLMRKMDMSYDDAHRRANEFEGLMRDGVLDGSVNVNGYNEMVPLVKKWLEKVVKE